MKTFTITFICLIAWIGETCKAVEVSSTTSNVNVPQSGEHCEDWDPAVGCFKCEQGWGRNETTKEDQNKDPFFDCKKCPPPDKSIKHCEQCGYKLFKTHDASGEVVVRSFLMCDTCMTSYYPDIFYNQPDDLFRMGRECTRCNLGGCTDCSRKKYCLKCTDKFERVVYEADKVAYCQRHGSYRLVQTGLVGGFCSAVLLGGYFLFCSKYYPLLNKKIKFG